MSRFDTHRSNQGFTRVELLAVAGVIALLAAFVIPAVNSAREKARQTQCKDNLHNLALGLHNYHDIFESFPVGCTGNRALPPERRWSWQIFGEDVLPSFTPMFDLNKAWDDPSLGPVEVQRTRNPDMQTYIVPLQISPMLVCPSSEPRSTLDGHRFADYVALAGVGSDGPWLPRQHPRAGIWAYDDVTCYEDCTDGSANTLCLIETASQRGCWLACGSATVRSVEIDHVPPIGSDRQFGGFHPGGGMALFTDGRVSLLSESTDAATFQHAATIADGKSDGETVW